MRHGKWIKTALALAASGLTLQFGTACDEKVPVKAEAPPPVARPAAAQDAGGARLIEITVTQDGYEPDQIQVKRGEPLLMRITRKTDDTCATEILIEGTEVNVPLPLNQPVEVNWTPTRAGALKFGCAMDKMISGILVVGEP